MGTDEQVMAWFMDTYSMHQGHAVSEIVTGKPVALGGTEGRREATGRGVAFLVNETCQAVGIRPSGATAIVQGFGNVGSVSAYTLARRYGVRVTGVSDHTAAFYDPAGLPLDAIEQHVARHRCLKGWSSEVTIDATALLEQPCDILVPAATERVIDAENAGRLRCRILAEGANGPTTSDGDAVLQTRGDVFVIPDILCNAGGVIVSYFEWVQDLQRLFWTEREVNERLEQLLLQAFGEVTRRSNADGIAMRMAAMAIGVGKLRAGKQLRGLFP